MADGDMTLARREHDRVIELEICGEVDIYSAKSLGRELENLACKKKHILLDLFQTYYIDSIGLSLFIAFHKKQWEKGKILGLCSPGDNMKRILNLTGLYGFLTIFENKGDALCALSEGRTVNFD